MAAIDIFKSNAFSAVSITSALNNVAFQPSFLRDLNIFAPRPVRTTSVAVEERNGTLSLIQTSERGVQGTYSGFTVTNSRIPGYQSGEGARLDRRYVDGVRTDAPLLPWPMESRGSVELGLSIGQLWQQYSAMCK